MFNFVKKLATATASSIGLRSFLGLPRVVKGQDSMRGAATTISYEVMKDTAAAAVRIMANGMPVPVSVSTVVGEVASKGVHAAFDRNDISIALLKGALCGVNMAIAGPICAIPLNMATDYAVNASEQKITLAYNNYKNAQGWQEMYAQCAKLGPKFDHIEAEEEFVDFRPAPAA